MTIQIEKPSATKINQWQAKFTKTSDLVFLTEPAWVLAAAFFVYISVISGWASFVPWVCLVFAFSPFPLRLIRYGYLSRRTPFDIPIAIFLGGVIVGMMVSDQFEISLGAFQTFLVCTAAYYSLVNYSRPAWIVKTGLFFAVVGAFIGLVYAVKWFRADIHIPNGLIIAMFIIVAIALGFAIFNMQTIQRLVIGLFGLITLGMAVFLAKEPLHRLLTLESIEGRLWLWREVITPIEGSSLWTGLGLGCWPSDPSFTAYGHVHNAYLEIYINTGIIGVIALLCFAAVGAKLTFDIIYSPRSSPYYGLGVGVIMAALAVLAVGFVESAPFGFGLLYKGSYHYILSPIPFILMALLVIARRLLRESTTAELAESAENNYTPTHPSTGSG